MPNQFKVFGLKALVLTVRGLRQLKHPPRVLWIILRPPLKLLWLLVFKLAILPAYKVYLRLRREIISGGQGLKIIFTNRANAHVFTILAVLLVVFNLVAGRTFAAPDLSTRSMLLSFLDKGADLSEILVEEKDIAGGDGLGYIPLGFADLNEDDEEIFSLIAGGGAFLRPLGPTPAGILTRFNVESYTVGAGDTISSIAQKFGVSINTIIWANKLTVRSVLRLGQKLIILPTTGAMHTVRRGDTIQSIASKYKGSVEKIITFNNLATQTLQVGQIIIVPDGRVPPPPPPPPRPRAPQFVPQLVAGKMLWPIGSKRITQYFWWRHPAVDFGAPTGSPIYAAENGIVEFIKLSRTGYGYQIMVDHGNGLRTRYAHNSRLLVRPGDPVQKGDIIAYSGNTGRSTGPHLHFEIFIGGKRVNPLQYIR